MGSGAGKGCSTCCGCSCQARTRWHEPLGMEQVHAAAIQEGAASRGLHAAPTPAAVEEQPFSAKQPATAIALSLLLMNRFHRANQPSSLALLRMPIGGCPSPAHAHLLHPRAAAPRCPDLTRVPQQTYSCCCERRRMK